MAEAVFSSLTSSSPLIDHSKIDSAGTAAYHTLSPPDSRTMTTLRKHGITNYDHRARKVQTDEFRNFDYIFAMDEANLEDLLEVGRTVKGKSDKEASPVVRLFGDYGGKIGEEVMDPYYGGGEGFEIAYHQMVRFTQGFLKELEG